MEENQNDHIELFGKLMKQHDYVLHKICHKYGIYRGQHHILRALEKNPGLTQNELATMIGVAKASITTSLTRMEKNGFVYRIKSQEDARCNQIFITDKGKIATNGIDLEINKLKVALFSQINDSDHKHLTDIFGKLIAGLNTLDID